MNEHLSCRSLSLGNTQVAESLDDVGEDSWTKGWSDHAEEVASQDERLAKGWTNHEEEVCSKDETCAKGTPEHAEEVCSKDEIWAKGWTVLEPPDEDATVVPSNHPIVWNYKYTPGQTIDISKIREATQLILESPTADAVILSDGLLAFDKELERMKPWTTAVEADAISLMLFAWSVREEVFNKKVDSEFCSVVYEALPSEIPQAKKDKDEGPPKPVKFDVDETSLPYSAWALHQKTEARVLAAARYMGGLKNLSEDALLETAKVEALTLISEGGKTKEEVGLKFMEQYDLLDRKGKSRAEKKLPKDGDEIQSDEGYDTPDFWIADEGEDDETDD